MKKVELAGTYIEKELRSYREENVKPGRPRMM